MKKLSIFVCALFLALGAVAQTAPQAPVKAEAKPASTTEVKSAAVVTPVAPVKKAKAPKKVKAKKVEAAKAPEAKK